MILILVLRWDIALTRATPPQRFPVLQLNKNTTASWRVTDIDNEGHSEKLCETPNEEEMKAIFNKYCPLCMCYYRNILKTR